MPRSDGFKRTSPPRAPRQPAKPVERQCRQADLSVASKPVLKTPDRKSQPIRDSARGEECTVRIAGVCNHDPATTVWSHAPFAAAGKGGALKGLDVLGCYSCAACHNVVDGRAPRPAGLSREQALLDWFFGMARSIVRLRQKGLV